MATTARGTNPAPAGDPGAAGTEPDPRTRAPSASRRARAAYLYWAYAYRRTWRGSIVGTVVSPVIYLAAMGLGLGALVDSSSGPGLGAGSYLQFVAPGILAATAMQTGAGESMYPVLGAMKWQRQYHAMLASPLTVRDIFLGHLVWVGTRVLIAAGIFAGVMIVFGAAPWSGALLAVPAAVLVGVAFAAPVMAFAATRTNDVGFSGLTRFGLIPLFLFSGVFFPIDQLPAALHPLAYATPLWHGVELCRGAVLDAGMVGVGDGAGAGRAGFGLGAALGHVGYLLVMTALGIAAAARTFRRGLLR
jgi:lipooligosaccharide transport system permease protein